MYNPWSDIHYTGPGGDHRTQRGKAECHYSLLCVLILHRAADPHSLRSKDRNSNPTQGSIWLRRQSGLAGNREVASPIPSSSYS